MNYDFTEEKANATAVLPQNTAAAQMPREPTRHRPLHEERLEPSATQAAAPGQRVSQARIEPPQAPGNSRDAGPVQKRFMALNDMGVKYVVVDGYQGLPFDLGANQKRIVILFEATTGMVAGRITTQDELHSVQGKDRQIRSILGLRDVDPSAQLFMLSEGGKSREVLLIPKGVGFWPDMFERRVINSRRAYNGCVAVPDADCTALAMLHHKLHRSQFLAEDPGLKDTLVEWIDGKVGMAQTCEIPGYDIVWPSKRA